MAVQNEKKAATSNSGIKKDSDGNSVIPSSTRSDGSVRKEIKVKPGYRPPEDVEVYKNRTAESWKNRGKGGVLGAEKIATDQPTQVSATAARNAKRREARRRAAAGQDDGEEQKTQDMEVPKTEPVDPEVEKAKEARKLAKKLRQARELQDKKASGEGLLPEQLAKVIKINELIRQLDNLGFDTEGEAKAETASDGVEKSEP